MHLDSIKLLQFKNYEQAVLQFSPQINAFVGQNGMGKTNLLDAIYYLCMGKSYFNLSDQFISQHETSFFRLDGTFVLSGEKTQGLVIKVEPKKRKELLLNKRKYERLADHVGVFPVVIVVPDDTKLIREGSEERRKFLDNTLSQLDAAYLASLLNYNQILKQRNALLKQLQGRSTPEDLLLVYDRQLAAPAQYIHQQRQQFITNFTPPFQAAHQAICGGQESVQLTYRSTLFNGDFLELLQAARQKDSILERTTMGIHKDDLVFKLGKHPLKRLGSQGQLKSFVLALKLAQYRFLEAEKNVPPILLLDDIFDKLDPRRVTQLITYLLREKFGQIFLTDTDQERIENVMKTLEVTPVLYRIEEGEATRAK
ncbi:MAG: DNA replication and repair protein RecF [Bacteroidota bacterium]